jgi:hypothetical protein
LAQCLPQPGLPRRLERQGNRPESQFRTSDLVRADQLIDTRWHSIEAALQPLPASLAAKP